MKTRIATSLLFGSLMALALVAVTGVPAVGIVVLGLYSLMPFVKLPKGILGAGAAGAGEEEEEEEVTLKSLQELIEKFNAKNAEITKKQGELDAAVKKLAAGEEETAAIKALKAEIKTLSEGNTSMQSILIKQGEMLTKLSTAVPQKSEGTFMDVMRKQWDDNKEKLAGMKAGEVKSISFEVPLDLVQKATVVNADVQNSTASQVIPGIGQQPYRRIFVESLFAAATISEANNRGVITYTDQDTLVRGANNIISCDAFPESSINWIEQNCKIEKIGDSIKVCIDAMEDFAFIESEVRNFLAKNVELKTDQQYLLGTGVSPQIKGVDSVAATWAAGAFALSIQSPTVYDVISTGVTQVSNAGQNNFYTPNWTLMNPTDVEFMRLTKDQNDNYIMPPFADLSQFSIRGTKIVETPLVVQNTLYIGDFTKGVSYTRRSLTVEMANMNEDDFDKDLVTLKASVRKALVIRNVHANAFLKVDDIAQAITDLTKP